MKKLLVMFVSILLIVGLFIPAAAGAASKGFKDVKDDYWAKEEIEYLIEKKIISDYDDKTFKPNKGITNAQGAVMLVRATGLKLEKNPTQIFKDVNKKHSAYKEISAAVKAGIFQKGDKFHPNKQMTRADVALAISKAFNLKGTKSMTFKDIPKNSPAYNAISALAEKNIVTGDSKGNFHPNKKVTRVEFSVMVARALNSDFLPDLYTIPFNMNPVYIMFNFAIKNPDGAQHLFLPESNFNLKEFSKNVISFDNVNAKENGRSKGLTEIVVTFDAKLNKDYKGTLVEGKNQLYIVIKRVAYMDFKVVYVGKTPYLKGSNEFTDKQALNLIDQSHIAYMTVIRGGDGKRVDATMKVNGNDYRYMAESLNTMEKLQKYLKSYYTPAKADAIVKELGIIVYKGKTVQPIADGGSIADYSRATIKLADSSATVRIYEVIVPLGNTKDTERKYFELHFVPNVGWRIADSFSDVQAKNVIAEAKKAYWNVVSGGEGHRIQITFRHDGMDYRYMAESLGTMEKLKMYLSKHYTPAKVEDIIKRLGIITHDGKLAQPIADGGSLLDYSKASIQPLSYISPSIRTYELSVPLGDTGKNEKVTEELQLVAGQGWRVAEAISERNAINLFAESQKAYWTVVRGGDGKAIPGSFDYKGKDYRWMAESLDTIHELKNYLNLYYTSAKTDEVIKQLGIVEIKGKLAQPNADGGSLADYSKAKVSSVEGTATSRTYAMTVPLGDTGLKEKVVGELQFVIGAGWRVSK